MVEKRYYNREIETMSREQLLNMQWRMLKEQLEYTYAHSGLCQRQFRAAKITPDDIKTREDFISKVPFTTKQDLIADQAESPPYGTRLCVPKNEIYLTYLTSGTSGKGQEVHVGTKEDIDFFFGVVENMYVWSGWQKGEKVMHPLPLGMTVAAPSHTAGLQRIGCDIFSLGMYDTKTKLEYIKRFEITAIFSVPAYLATLTAEAEQMGLDPARDLAVRKILIATQAYPVSFVHQMEQRWNAKIYDYYGSTQMADGCTCEKGAVIGDQRGYYHVFEWLALIEVIDPETLKPVGPGEIGEVIVTPLKKRASPFLRFRQGDRVRYFPHTYCDCGRPYMLFEAGTISRYDDMMKIKGVNVWPETIDEIVLTKEGTSEYQGRLYITEDKKEKSDIRIEFKKGVPADVKQNLMTKIADEIRDTTGIGFIVKEATEPLPHSVFKVRRWTDDRQKGMVKE
ncbi:MAG: AMP-binding protein [Chloroflexi bacterium]|nr:AMP-binding protein [Chloroflexota bacterium]